MRTVFLAPENARDRMVYVWQLACALLELGKSVRVRIDEHRKTRSLEQNDKLWACLGDIADQVEWPVDGRMQRLEAADWKDILSAGLKRNQRVAQGVEGGFVVLGQHTSRMSVAEMVELIEFIQWFGAEKGVRWSETFAGPEKARR